MGVGFGAPTRTGVGIGAGEPVSEAIGRFVGVAVGGCLGTRVGVAVGVGCRTAAVVAIAVPAGATAVAGSVVNVGVAADVSRQAVRIKAAAATTNIKQNFIDRIGIVRHQWESPEWLIACSSDPTQLSVRIGLVLAG